MNIMTRNLKDGKKVKMNKKRRIKMNNKEFIDKSNYKRIKEINKTLNMLNKERVKEKTFQENIYALDGNTFCPKIIKETY